MHGIGIAVILTCLFLQFIRFFFVLEGLQM